LAWVPFRPALSLGTFLTLSEEDKQCFGAFIAKQLSSYIDDDGMAVSQENHFLLAHR
jgi:hypothetical protein